MFVTVTRYSSVEPASAGPPPTTETCFVIDSCWTAPTTTTVGWAPFPGLPSPSVRRFGSSTLSTTAWLMIRVPAGVPRLTRRSNCSVAVAPGEIVPAPGPGSGGVRLDELMLIPDASGGTPPSGTVGLMSTSKVMIATLAGGADGSAGIDPGVGLLGGWISMPLTSGDRPATSATGAPFRVVLPAT